MGKVSRSAIFYVLIMLAFGSLIYLIIKAGEHLESSSFVSSFAQQPSTLSDGFRVFKETVSHHANTPLGVLLMQIIVILITCRIFSWLFLKLGQPTVIGEIIAGIVLGPSIFGYFFPETSAILFPIESLGNIALLSQFGLVLFMFAIGMELDLKEVRRTMKQTVLISHTNTIIPFALGMITAYFVYEKYAYEDTPFLSFALFIGIAMSITAFPVLARIIQERGLTKTHLGTLTLSSAANGDITAWCLLAVVVSIANAGNVLSASFNILFAVLYVLFMFYIIRPFLRMIGNVYHNDEVLDKAMVAFIFLLVIISVYMAELLGLHALFGAFIAGLVMPPNMRFRKIMTEKVEDVGLSLFLPLFFVSTGLRTHLGLLDSTELWLMCGVFIAVAILGKFGSAFAAARVLGENTKNSLYIGALMNTRGLMELIVLVIGYEMRILPPTIFVMLVLMTLVTTFMTTPLLSLIQYFYHRKNKTNGQNKETQSGKLNLLLPFGRAGSGQTMLNLVYQLFSEDKRKLDVTALHLTVGANINPMQLDNFEEVSFAPIMSGATKLGIPIRPRYKLSSNAGQDIVDFANDENFDFMLVGAGISMSNLPNDIEANQFLKTFNRFFRRFRAPESWFSPGKLLKDKTKMFIEQVDCTVGIFINRNFVKAHNVVLIINNKEDLSLLNYINPLVKSTARNVNVIIKMSKSDPSYEVIRLTLYDFTVKESNVTFTSSKKLNPSHFYGNNLMLISYDAWNELSEEYNETLQRMPSTLIIRERKSAES